MKRIILILFLIFSLAVPAGAQMIVGGASTEPNMEVGYTNTSGTGSSGSSRRIEITVTSTMTVRYGYLYAYSNNSDTFTMAVYQTDGTQVGTCSGTSAPIPASNSWMEVTWATPFVLSPGTYYLQYHATGGSTTIIYNRTATGSNNAYGTDACGTLFTNSSTYKVAMTIANYQAH